MKPSKRMSGLSSSALRRLGYSTVFMFSGSLAYAASQWIIVVAYARLLGPEAVGLFALAIAISTPLITLSQLSFRQVLLTDALARFGHKTYVVPRIALSIASLILCAPIYLLLGFTEQRLVILIIFSAARVVDSVGDVYHSFLHLDDRLGAGALIAIFRSLLGVALAAGAVAATQDLMLSACGFLMASAAGLCLNVQLTRRYHEGRQTSWAEQLMLLRTAWPAGISSTVSSLSAYVPRFVLERVGGVALVGQAAVLEYLLALGTLVVVALGQVASKHLAEALRAGRRRAFIWATAAAAAGVGLFGVAAAAVSFVWGPWAVTAIYGRDYLAAAEAIGPVMLGGACTYVGLILWFAVMATGRFQGMTVRATIILAVTSLGSWWAIEAYGLQGFGLALAASGLTATVVWSVHLVSALRTR